MTAAETIAERAHRLGRANGFDGLRLFLAFGIVAFHSYTLTVGNALAMAWPLKGGAQLILPAFFVLSGYLVSASLARCDSVREFVLLRLLRIVPALTVVILVSILLLGPLLTTAPLRDYFSDSHLPAYLQNILGLQHFHLPGLFETNPRAGIVNGSLWTVQLEMVCYGLLAVLALLSRRWGIDLGLAALAVLLLFPRVPLLGLLLAWLPAKELVLGFVVGALLQRFAGCVPLHPLAGLAALLLAFWLAGFHATLAMLPLGYGVIWLALRRIPVWLTRADYSYGLYLAAYPLQQSFIFLFAGISWWENLMLALPVAMLYAVLSWHGVERPMLARKHEIVARLAGSAVAVRA